MIGYKFFFMEVWGEHSAMDHPRPPVLLTYKRKDKGIKENAEQGNTDNSTENI